MTVERSSLDLGRKLREARERKGVSLRDISNTTKIAVAVLEGLERNDITRLPGGIFGRAFVRSFATEVGLDPEASIQEFMAQYRDDPVAVGHPPSERIEDDEVLERNQRAAWTMLGLVALTVLTVAVVTYFVLARGAQPSIASPQPGPDTIAAAADEVPPPPPDASAVTAASRDTVSDSTIANPGAATQPVATAPADRMTITLAVTRNCWVSAIVDGEKRIGRVLKPGDRRSLEVRKELALNLGDAGAVRMTINGVATKALGRSGEVLTTRVNLANVKKFLPPQ